MENGFLTKKWKPILVGITIFVLIINFIYAIFNRKMPAQTFKEMTVMQNDMESLLKNGGQVVYRKENAKYGGALLLIILSEESWSDELKRKNEKTLSNAGWNKKSEDQDKFCKDGIQAEMAYGMYKGHGAISLSMAYNGVTIKNCK